MRAKRLPRGVEKTTARQDTRFRSLPEERFSVRLLLADSCKEAVAMSHVWPAETAFERVDLFLKGQGCGSCQTKLAVWGHRQRRVFPLSGARLLVVRQGHCPEPDCPGHHESVSSWQEMAVAPPSLTIAWDVLAWIGHRRFARHWSVPQNPRNCRSGVARSTNSGGDSPDATTRSRDTS